MKTCPACGKQNKDKASVCEGCQSEFDSVMDKKTRLFTEDKPSFSKGSFISNRYEIVKELGRGGMGIVYLVKDIKLRGRQVALKMIHPELVSHEEAKQRFIDEVLLCLDLHHPNIVIVYPLEESEQSLFFTMEYISGKSLRQVMDERKETTPPFFTLKETTQVINPLLDALSYAHQTTIHRDIKPENILIMGDFPDIQVKILDFGIAKVLSASRFTRTAQSMGTAYYMSPEQMQGAKHIDQRSDLYSVGMILYEMLTGELAAGRFDLPGEIIKSLPKQIDNIVDQVLSPRPDKRHQNAQILKSELSNSLSHAEEKTQELIEEINVHLKKAEFKQAEEKLVHINSPTDLTQEYKRIENRYNEHIKKGDNYSSSGEFVQAKKCFQEALDSCPESQHAKQQLEKNKVKQRELAAKIEKDRKEELEKQRENQRIDQEKKAAIQRVKEDDLKKKQEQARLDLEQKQKEEREKREKLEKEKQQQEIKKREKEKIKKEKQEAQLAAKAKKKKLVVISIFLIAIVVILTMVLSTKPERVTKKTDPPEILTPTSKPAEKLVINKYGKLNISSNPSGASVYINQSYRGTTRLTVKDLQKGKHQIKLSNNGYKDLNREVLIEAGKTKTISYDLEKLQYALHITAKPSDAKIKILNIVPKFEQGMLLDPGKYQVEVSASGYITRTKWHTLQSGEDNINIELTRKVPVQEQVVLKPKEPHKKTWTDPATGMEFVWVPKGCYQMGSNSGDSDEKPVHVVCLDGFWIGRYEVTQGQYKKIMGRNPSSFRGDARPVEKVSWNDAKKFISRLNQKSDSRFILPFEAQWEYAARSGGKNQKYSGGSDVGRFAWYDSNSGGKTHNVGTKSPNGLGIYDMSGNVWEWCEDVYDKKAYFKHSRNNPVVTSGGSRRVDRGGSWFNSSGGVRCADRSGSRPSSTYDYLGFRLVRKN
ncbi:MAG: SUMF1/EgtB/PvdO family nonheme iron enzyme [Desulfobacula sp.]|nr:SUMF1/EgtB/PvdO family nonheme iron enzyme [Desulfobacula sp.]